jgi:hypothetical protein
MLLLKQEGSNWCTFNNDKLQYDWDGKSVEEDNPNVALILSLTNDTTREMVNVTLIKDDAQGSSEDFIIGGDRHISGAFFATLLQSPDGSIGRVQLQPRGYWEYVLYEHNDIASYPNRTTLTSGTLFNALSLSEVDRGKALLVTDQQYDDIRLGNPIGPHAGSLQHRELTSGEVSYTEHTDKVASSQIDTDENYIHVP